MKRKLIDSCIISLLFGGSLLLQAAPPIISYSGQVAVNGSPFTGTGQFKFVFVGGNGKFSYWSQDGTSTIGSEPTGYVSALVSNGIYSIMLGDDAISGMGTINESIFQDHNDVHLRVWFSDGVNGFQQLTPDRRFASVPYSLASNGTNQAQFDDSSDTSGSTDVNATQRVTQAGGYVRLVADGPASPSSTLVLLDGDVNALLVLVK